MPANNSVKRILNTPHQLNTTTPHNTYTPQPDHSRINLHLSNSLSVEMAAPMTINIDKDNYVSISPRRTVSPASSKASDVSGSRRSPPPATEDTPPPAKRRSQGPTGSNLVTPIIINLTTRTVITKTKPPSPPPQLSAGPEQEELPPLRINEEIQEDTVPNDVNPASPDKTIIDQVPQVTNRNIRDTRTDLDDCPHSSSFSIPISPDAIISNPFSGNMLTCLRQLKTEPCDMVSPSLPANPRHRLKVYACYQQHWYPKINMPVLTLVAPCGVSISPPSFKRKFSARATLKFIASSTGQQENLKFNLPLLIPRTMVSSSIVMTHGPSSSCPDTITSYILKTTAPELNLVWIKVIHLSVIGCYSLHVRSLITLARPSPTSEIHILGLSAARHTSYTIMHQSPSHIGIKFLQEHELQAIGWKKNPMSLNNLWKPNTSVFIAPTPILQQMQFTRPSFFATPNTICIAPKEIIPVTDPSLVPLHYPSLKTHEPTFLAPAPQLYFTTTKLSPAVHRLRDIPGEVSKIIKKLKPPPGLTKKEFFLTMFNVPADSLDDPGMTHNDLSTFLERYSRHGLELNRYCRFRNIKTYKEPYHYGVPRSWLYLTEHDFIKAESKRSQFPAREEHDWS